MDPRGRSLALAFCAAPIVLGAMMACLAPLAAYLASYGTVVLVPLGLALLLAGLVLQFLLSLAATAAFSLFLFASTLGRHAVAALTGRASGARVLIG